MTDLVSNVTAMLEIVDGVQPKRLHFSNPYSSIIETVSLQNASTLFKTTCPNVLVVFKGSDTSFSIIDIESRDRKSSQLWPAVGQINGSLTSLNQISSAKTGNVFTYRTI